MRLNHYIAQCGYTSRRNADKLIAQGKVKVNNYPARAPYLQVTDKDLITVENTPLKLPSGKTYIIFNKPVGVTSTHHDRFAEKTVFDYLPKELSHLATVGRLDKNSCGLMILTNDGSFCYQLTHPRFSVEKEYRITVKGQFTKKNIAGAKKGIFDQGELLKVKSIKILEIDQLQTQLNVIICEGKKRHLRRLFKNIQFPILSLERIRIANVSLNNLPQGKWEYLPPSLIKHKLKHIYVENKIKNVRIGNLNTKERESNERHIS